MAIISIIKTQYHEKSLFRQLVILSFYLVLEKQVKVMDS